MNLEHIYHGLPVGAQNALCSLYGAHLIRRRYNSAYEKLEKEVFQREVSHSRELEIYSAERLRSIIAHAMANVQYYRNISKCLGLRAEDIRGVQDLSSLPILQKHTVQRHLSEFQSDNLKEIPHSIVHTSGTTGAGLIFPLSLEAEQEQWAVWWRYRARFGIDRATWYAHFYGKTIVPQPQMKPPFWRINRPGHQILFSAYHMSNSNLPYYVEELNNRRPPWIQGYPSLLAILANFILENGLKLSYQPDIVTVGAESLLPQQKNIIEAAFRTTCRQHYGMTEGVANISECPEGILHVDEDYAHVEFVHLFENVYRIIGTGYSNYAFPLIRYDTGDIAELYEDRELCPCGRPGRLVKSIDGRIEDYVITPDGRRIGRMDHIFKDMTNIKECQIYQDCIEKITIRVVRGINYTSHDEELLLNEVRTRLGNQIGIEIRYQEKLERTKSGKLRFVVSKLPEAKISGISGGSV